MRGYASCSSWRGNVQGPTLMDPFWPGEEEEGGFGDLEVRHLDPRGCSALPHHVALLRFSPSVSRALFWAGSQRAPSPAQTWLLQTFPENEHANAPAAAGQARQLVCVTADTFSQPECRVLDCDEMTGNCASCRLPRGCTAGLQISLRDRWWYQAMTTDDEATCCVSTRRGPMRSCRTRAKHGTWARRAPRAPGQQRG